MLKFDEKTKTLGPYGIALFTSKQVLAPAHGNRLDLH